MNDLTASSAFGTLRREFRDTHALVSRIDRRITPSQRTGPSPQQLLARTLACHVLGAHATRAPAAIAAERYRNEAALLGALAAPGMIGKAVSPPAMIGTPAWAGELATPGIADLDTLQLISPASIYSQISQRPLAIRVSLVGRASMKVPSRAPSPSFSPPFIAEGAAIPVRQLALGSASVLPRKASVISMFSQEMLARSLPSIESLIRAVMGFDAAVSIDGVLLGATAPDTISPGGILYGVTATPAATGGGLPAFAQDVRNLAAAIETSGPMIDPCLLMSSTSQLLISVLAMNGTSDVPIIASHTVPAKQLIMLDAANFASGEGDTPDISTSKEALLHEESSPLPLVGGTGTPTLAQIAAPVRSMFQTACIGARLVQDVSWTLTRAGRVAYIDPVSW